MTFRLIIEDRDDVVAKSERKGFDPVFVRDEKLYVLLNASLDYLTNKSGTRTFVYVPEIQCCVAISSLDDYKLEVKYGDTYKVYELM